jgi:hypothetical protein
MPNIIIHPTRRNVDSEPQLGLWAGDDGRYMAQPAAARYLMCT